MNELTLIIGKILSLYLIVTGLGFFLSPKFFRKMVEMGDKSDPVMLNLSGMVHFLIGATILTNHFLWGSALEIIVSIFGFAFLIKGALLIAIPEVTLKANKTSVKYLPLSGAGFIAMGLVLGYLSYFAW